MNSTCQVEKSTLFKNTCLWTAPKVRVRPVEGEIQLWLAPIGFDAVDVPIAWKTLSQDEKDRAHRFHCGRDGGLFIRGRYQLRLLLANCLGILPEEVEFAYEANGKPRLKQEQGLQFSLSRSQDAIAVALTMKSEIGVDMEIVSDGFPADELAARHFCHSEREALNELEGEARLSMFYRIWTAREALMKATGEGIAIDPHSVQTAIGADGRLDGYIDPVSGAPRAEWCLKNVHFACGRVISIASRGESSLLVFQA